MLSILVIGKKVFVSGEALEKVRDCLDKEIVECLKRLREWGEVLMETHLFADWEGYEFARDLYGRLKHVESIRCAEPELLSRKLGQYMAKREGLEAKTHVVVLEAVGDEMWWHQDVMSEKLNRAPEKMGDCGLASEKQFVFSHLVRVVSGFLSNEPDKLDDELKILQNTLPEILDGLRNGKTKFGIQFPNKLAKVDTSLLRSYLEWQLTVVNRISEKLRRQPDGTVVYLMGEIFEVLLAQTDVFSEKRIGKKRVRKLLGMSPQELCDQINSALKLPAVSISEEKKDQDDNPKSAPTDPLLEGLIADLVLANREVRTIAEDVGRKLVRLRGRYLVVQANDSARPEGKVPLDLSHQQAVWTQFNALPNGRGLFPQSYKHLSTQPWIDEVELATGDWRSLRHCLLELDRIGLAPSQRNYFADAVTDSLLRLLAAYYDPAVQIGLGTGSGLVGLPTLHADALLLHLSPEHSHFWRIRNPELRLWTLGVLPSELHHPGMQSYLDWWATQHPELPLPSHWRDFRTWDIRKDARAILAIVLAIAGPENAPVAVNARLLRLLRLSKQGAMTEANISRIAYPRFFDRLRNSLIELLGASDVEINL